MILNLFGEKQTAVETEASQEKVVPGSLQDPTEPVCTIATFATVRSQAVWERSLLNWVPLLFFFE